MKYWALSEKQDFHVIPTDTISISIDKDAVLRSGIMLPDSIRHLKGEDLKNAIPDKIYISLKDMRNSNQGRYADAGNACQLQLGTPIVHGNIRR